MPHKRGMQPRGARSCHRSSGRAATRRGRRPPAAAYRSGASATPDPPIAKAGDEIGILAYGEVVLHRRLLLASRAAVPLDDIWEDYARRTHPDHRGGGQLPGVRIGSDAGPNGVIFLRPACRFPDVAAPNSWSGYHGRNRCPLPPASGGALDRVQQSFGKLVTAWPIISECAATAVSRPGWHGQPSRENADMGVTQVNVVIRNPANPPRSWGGRFLVGTSEIDSLDPRPRPEPIGPEPKRQRI